MKITTLSLLFALAATAEEETTKFISGSTGNGDFEASEPDAEGAQEWQDTPHWFHLNGVETTAGNFTHDQGTLGSPQASSRAALAYKGPVTVNDTGYKVTKAGEVIDVSYAMGRFGNGYDGDESLRVFLFTTEKAINGMLASADVIEVAEEKIAVQAPPAEVWNTYASKELYTTTADDVGKTLYFGFELENKSGEAVFPRVDLIEVSAKKVAK
ncbi:MAG: hypothetical protein ACSHYB_06030 [Roseibacillus sp.]